MCEKHADYESKVNDRVTPNPVSLIMSHVKVDTPDSTKVLFRGVTFQVHRGDKGVEGLGLGLGLRIMG